MQNNPTTTEQMKRADFLRTLGMSSAALMAFYCMGTLTACSGGGDDPAPAPNPPAGSGFTGNADTSKGAISFTLDLTSSAYSKLKTAGQFVIVGSTIVASTTTGIVSLSKTCTHQGTEIQYRAAQNDFFCSNHGSEFSTTGAVEVGPATQALTKYNATLSNNSNTLTVTA